MLDLSNYDIKKELEHAIDVDVSDLAAYKHFIPLKAEVGKLDIGRFFNVPTSLNDLKTKVDDSNVSKLKTVPIDLKNSGDVADNQVVKNAKFNTLKTKVNKLDKEISAATTLIYINQYNTGKQNLDKYGDGDIDKKHQTLVY